MTAEQIEQALLAGAQLQHRPSDGVFRLKGVSMLPTYICKRLRDAGAIERKPGGGTAWQNWGLA